MLLVMEKEKVAAQTIITLPRIPESARGRKRWRYGMGGGGGGTEDRVTK